jgi:hypothetical protein
MWRPLTLAIAHRSRGYWQAQRSGGFRTFANLNVADAKQAAISGSERKK